jgi:hypothetical protein
MAQSTALRFAVPVPSRSVVGLFHDPTVNANGALTMATHPGGSESQRYALRQPGIWSYTSPFRLPLSRGRG